MRNYVVLGLTTDQTQVIRSGDSDTQRRFQEAACFEYIYGGETGLFIDNEDYLSHIVSHFSLTPNMEETTIEGLFVVRMSQGTTGVDTDTSGDLPWLVGTGTSASGSPSLTPEPIVDDGIPKVIMHTWNGAGYVDFETVFKKLLPVVDKNIVIDVPHGNYHKMLPQEKRDKKNFYVRIWSTPWKTFTKKREQSTPDTLFGKRDFCKDAPFKSTHKGIQIYDEAENGGTYVIGELFKNHLYIHHDAVHFGSLNEIAIMEGIIQSVIMVMSFTPAEMEAYEQEKIERIKKKTEENFTKFFNKSYKRQIDSYQEKIGRYNISIIHYKQKLVESIRGAQDSRERLDDLKAHISNNTAEVEKVMSNVMGIPKVTYLSIEDDADTISVFTDMLTCKHPETGDIHAIGKFKIVVNFATGDIKWHNQTKKVDAYNHKMNAPHVFENGEPCLGDIAATISELIGAYDIFQTTVIAISFIESINITDSAGQHLGNWPILKPKKKAITETEVKLEEAV